MRSGVIARRFAIFLRNAHGTQMPSEVGEFAVLAAAPYRLLRWRLLWAASAAAVSLCVSCTTKKHVVSVTFDYDFTETGACSSTIFTGCIAQFNVYDVGARKPVKLFSIPAPAGAHSLTKDIVGKSQPLAIGSGRHVLAVSAQTASGEESSLQECTAGTILP
jgi:hypothetical protein